MAHEQYAGLCQVSKNKQNFIILNIYFIYISSSIVFKFICIAFELYSDEVKYVLTKYK